MARLLAPVFALMISACGSEQQVTTPADVRIEEGLPFPSLVLPSLEGGRPSAVAGFRGKKTLLHVFASW